MGIPSSRLSVSPCAISWVAVLAACGSSAASGNGPPADGGQESAQPPGDDGASSGSTTDGGGVSACDGVGVPSVPSGFPALGGACLSHFTFEYTDSVTTSTFHQDVVGAHGLRSVVGDIPGGYAVGARNSGETPVVIFLQTLQVGTYRGTDGVQITSRDITATLHDSAFMDGAAFVEVVSSTPDIVYGRFLADGCADQTNQECNVFAFGRFAAVVDSGSLTCSAYSSSDPTTANCSELEVDRRSAPVTEHVATVLCETVADCPSPFTGPFDGKTCASPSCVRPSYGGHMSTSGNGACACP